MRNEERCLVSVFCVFDSDFVVKEGLFALGKVWLCPDKGSAGERYEKKF